MRNWLQPKKVLNDRQLSKVKTSMALLAFVLLVQGAVVVFASDNYWYNGDYYDKSQIKLFPRGRIVEYSNLEEFCDR